MAGFSIGSTSGNARAGILRTSHGNIKTPFVMPVATKGSVKLLTMEEVESTGVECLISNAFMLSMKPGAEVVERHGGLHGFMGWEKGVFTDSGGFQVLSKGLCLGSGADGVTFRNPYTGKTGLFTPEESIKIQNSLGGDVAMCLDDVPRADASLERLKEAVGHTALWAKRCMAEHSNSRQMLFGICQGGTHAKLREKSALEISSLGFDGHAIGGLAIGEPREKTIRAVECVLPFLPKEKPRYMMGVGDIGQLRDAVALGVDCFDSCFATRTARHGRAFTSSGNINIDSSVHRLDTKPLDRECGCFVCQSHSRSYLHHLFRAKEDNAGKYLSYHNLHFLQRKMEELREEIALGKPLQRRLYNSTS